jgi:biopolymer transport protein ExbB
MFTEFNWVEATGGSWIFMVLVGCSIVTLAVALERAWYFWKRSENPDQTLSKSMEQIRKGKLKEAAWTCESSSHPMGKVASEVFKSNLKKISSLEERLQVVLSQQKLLLERNLSLLGTMAAICPLIGLLGTVWGIMRAFHDMAATGSAAPTVVAAGVAEALITTAAGLVVAVPALVLYNYFASRMNVMLTVAENHTRTIRAALGERESTVGTGTDAARNVEQDKRHAGETGRQSPEPAATR